MQTDIFVPRLDHVQNGMTSIRTHAFSITEPLVAILGATFDDTLWLVNAAVRTRMCR